MNIIILKFINLYRFFIFIALLTFNFDLFAKNKSNFKHVEAIGRSTLLPENIETSRKRALEDALYIAALKGGADINGFSTISSNTIINDQSIVKATNRVIDFKILSEKQNKEFLSVKIRAVVGDESSKFNCKNRPLNITLLKGSFRFDSNIPSPLGRFTPIWFNQLYEITSAFPNSNITYHKNKSVEDIIKSNINPSFDYQSLTNGLPKIEAGNYVLVPKLFLKKINEENNFLNYLLRVTYDIYKGQNLNLLSSKSYDLKIKHQYNSKFQFINNISTSNIDDVDKIVRDHLLLSTNKFLKEINCLPLEGKLTINDNKLIVALGKKQGIKPKQIGLVKGIYIKNSMMNNSTAIVHVNKIFDNYSTLLPLNDDIKLATMNNLVVKFVE